MSYASSAVALSPADAGDACAATPLPGLYRAFLRSKLHCPLPDAGTRNRVYAQTAEVLAKRAAREEAVALVDLSNRVGEALAGTVGQRTAFKLLFALVLANAFRIVRHDRPHAIRILSARAPVADWDRLFLQACLVGLRRDHPEWTLEPAVLADVFDVTPANLRRLIDSLPNPHGFLTRRPDPA